MVHGFHLIRKKGNDLDGGVFHKEDIVIVMTTVL